MNILITGGAGFIGSHVVRRFVKKYPAYNIINLDKLTYAGNLENLRDIENSTNYTFIKGDIVNEKFLHSVFENYKITSVIHLAAESHVDRSITNPNEFVMTNAVGTVNLLNAARKYWYSKETDTFVAKITKNEIQNVISGKSNVGNGKIMQAIAGYIRGNAGAISLAKEAKSYKNQEAEILKTFIEENNLWVSDALLKNFIGEGAEQKIYRFDEQNIIKLSDSVFYNSWEDYLHSLLLHNYFFPDTAYQLIGFAKINDVLFAVVKQPYVRTTDKTDLDSVKSFMNNNGFIRTKNNDYYSPELEIILEDLHDENVLTKEGVLYFVDTVFYLSNKPDKILNEGGKKGSCTHLFYHISTDEVYGALGATGHFTEETRYNPHSPYSASKAASDHFVRAYHDTYKLPVVISNCSNNYGSFQFPEKLIPLCINNIKNRKPLPVYGKGENVRDWLFVEDHAAAIDLIFHQGKEGETYNIGGNNEWKNIDLVLLLCRIMDKKLGREKGESEKLITFVKDRAGHDLRYAIDSSKLQRELGWKPSLQFEEGLEKTVDWYLANESWLNSITLGDYQKYYQKQYAR